MNPTRSLLWCLATVCVAAIVSFLVARETSHRTQQVRADQPSEEHFHDWLHDNLETTAEQEALLLPYELEFEESRERIREEIESAGQDLADAIREFEADSSEVNEARAELTSLQGELQQATLDHFFAMKKHLTEEQGEKLLHWTHESIVHGDHD